MLEDSTRYYPRLRPPGMVETDGFSALQTSFRLTLTFVSEVVIHNLQNCLSTTELKGKPLDYLIISMNSLSWKIDDFVCSSSKDNVTGSKLNSQLFLTINLTNCSETLSKALIHEDI